nr:hypothetical protein [uncultured Chryseobacterium sp.]
MNNKKYLEYILILITEIIVSVKFYINRNYFFDDTLIYARYIKNFAKGDGLVYNKGELFNGLTSPLFTYINLLINSIFKIENQILLNNSIGYFFISLSIVIIYLILKKLSYNFFIVGTVLILYSLSNIYLFLGMETSLYLFLIMALYYFYLTEKYLLYFLTVSLILITRTEGIFFVITTVLLFLYEKKTFKKTFLLYGLLSACILGIHFSFNLYYYGNILPDSSKAKIYHGISHYWGDRLDFLKGTLQLITYDYENRNLFKYLYFFIIFFIPTALFFKKKNSFDYFLILSNLFLLLFYLYFNVPLYTWYIAPLIFTKIYFIVTGLDYFISKIFGKKNNKLTIIFTGILLCLVSFILNYNNKYINSHDTQDMKREKDYIEISEWIIKNTANNESIGTAEIGIIGYQTDRKIIDLCGLVSRDNAYYLSQKDVDSWIIKYKPDYILFHDPKWIIEADIPLKHKNYLIVDNFNFKGYKMYKKLDK